MKRACLLVATLLLGGLSSLPLRADDGPPRLWQLNTEDTLCTLSVKDDAPEISVLKHPRADWNWGAQGSRIPLPREAYVTGTKVALRWTFADATVDTADGTKVTLRFVSADPRLELRSTWHARPFAGPVEISTHLENQSGGSITIRQRDLVVADTAFVADAAVELWRFNRLGFISNGKRGDPYVQSRMRTNGPDNPLYNTSFQFGITDAINDPEPPVLRDVLGPRDSLRSTTRNDAGWAKDAWLPYHVFNVGDRHGLYVGYVASFGRFCISTAGDPLKIRYEATLWDAGAFAIESGRTLRLPGLFLGTYQGDVDDGSNRMKRWFWKHKVPRTMRDNSDMPLIEYAAPTDERGFRECMEKHPFAEWGGELAKIDIEWTTPSSEFMSWEQRLHNCYDWMPDPGKWPNGMTAGDIAHAHRQQLSLYFFDAYKSCNLGTPEGRRQMEEALIQRYDDWHFDQYRADFFPEGRYNYLMHVGYMELLDGLIAKRPNFRFEHCCGGGALKDFDSLQRIHVMTTEDSNGALNYRQAAYSNLYMINPVQIRADVVSNYGQTGLSGYEISADPGKPFIDTLAYARYCERSGFLGAKCSGSFGTPHQEQAVREHWPIYKRQMRPILRGADVYHVLPYPDGVNWDGMQYWNAELQRGALLLFKPSAGAPDEKTIRLKGLWPDETYAVLFQDRKEQNVLRTGAQLMNEGLTVRGMQGDYASEIVWIQMPRGPAFLATGRFIDVVDEQQGAPNDD